MWPETGRHLAMSTTAWPTWIEIEAASATTAAVLAIIGVVSAITGEASETTGEALGITVAG